jgi:hypothetical protein
MSSFRRNGPFDMLLCGMNSVSMTSSLETHIEVDEEVEDDEDDCNNDVEQDENDNFRNDHSCQNTSSFNSLLATPPHSNRTKKLPVLVPVVQNDAYDINERNRHNILSSSSSPPPSRVMSPALSTSSSVYSSEAMSPIQWNLDDDVCDENDHPNDENLLLPPPPPFLPSFFATPWMCVFDLDAACGGGLDDAVHENQFNPTISPQNYHKDWNQLLPTMNLPQWFGTDGGSGCSTIHEQHSNQVMVDEHDLDDCSPTFIHQPLLPPPALPLSPTSVRHPIILPRTTSTMSTQLFTNFGAENGIEAIYVHRSILMVCLRFRH